MRPEELRPGDAERLSHSPWQRRARWLGYVILAVVTLFGIREFAQGNWTDIAAYWTHKLPWMPVIVAFFFLDLLLEGVAWIWVYQRFGVHAKDRTGIAVYLSGNAGLLMPAQLGRLIRPDSMVRLGRARMSTCLKAEGAVFVLDALSVLALLVAMIAWRVQPALGPIAGFAVVAVVLFLGHRVADRLVGTKLHVPHRFWWSKTSFVIVAVEAAGWIMHGIAFYILVADLPGQLTLWDALFYAPGSAVLGVVTGLPGGVGATEGLLGTALRFREVPAEHLALVVGAFRIITFWLRLPIGWLALAWVKRRAPKGAPAIPGEDEAEPEVEGVALAAGSRRGRV